MKKNLLRACALFILLPLHAGTSPSNKFLETRYKNALELLQKHLDETVLPNPERTILINKLIGYFNPPIKNEIFLSTTQAQLIYSFVTKSYNEILTAQKSTFNKSKEDFAKKFAEQALGKIILHKQKVKKV